MKEDIIRMAQKAYGPITGQWWDMDAAALKRFAEMVRADEREACAKVVETHAPTTTPTWVSYAAVIRARSNT